MGRNAHSCPECGRFFSAVRCPRCGFSGSAAQFVSGCPVCGYSLPADDLSAESARVERNDGPAAPLPTWTWLVAVAALVAAIVGMWSALR